MKTLILRSSLQTDAFVRNEYAELIERLENECHAETDTIGNRHVIIRGRHADEIRQFMQENNITPEA